jgi:uncharacterized phage-associated protein
MVINKKEKLKDLLLYIISKAGKIPKVKLAKLVLFSEIEYFNKTGESITDLYFVRLKKGPVIAFFDEVLDASTDTLWKKDVEDIPIHEEGRIKKQYLYSPINEKDISKELKPTIDKVVKVYGKKTGTELSRLSHSLPAWKYSEPNEPIYLAELAARNEEEYFALIDILEEAEEDDHGLEEKISRTLPPS